MISLVLASALVLTSALTLHYYSQYVTAEKRYTDTLSSLNEVSYKVNILINYGNGTKRWYNMTTIPIGWSLFNATLRATGGRVEGTWYSFGVFVTSINGVKGTSSKSWLWFSWDKAKSRWNQGATGSESYILKQGDIVGWLLTSEWTATP
jgi:hypothetical protein